jgi:uncharacterized membrane protein YfcA
MAETLAVLLGVVVGAVLGLTGAGGSILAVPLLMAGMGWTLPQAAPVALLAVCAATTFGTAVAWDATYVRWRAAMLMGLGAVVTAPLGLVAARSWPLSLLTGLFAGVLALVALRLIVQARRAPAETAVVRAGVAGDALPARGALIRLNARGRIAWDAAAVGALAAIGAGTGFVAGLLGVGGGFVIVPALRWTSRLSMHSVVATSLMAIALISGITAAGAALQGVDLRWPQAVPFVLGALGGMLAGRRVAPRVAGPRLQQGFAVVMLLVAIGLAAHAAGWI